MIMELRVEGCKRVSSIFQRKDAMQKVEFEQVPRNEDKLTMGVDMKMTYELSQNQKMSQKNGFLDAKFDIICDDRAYKLKENPVSLVVMQKQEKFSIKELNEHKLKSLQLQNVEIFDINTKAKKAKLNYSNKPGKITMMKTNKLAVSIGPLFPLVMEYDEEEGTLQMKFEEKWIPDHKIWTKKNENRSLEVGIMNVKENMLYSPELYKRLQTLKMYSETITMTIFRQNGKMKKYQGKNKKKVIVKTELKDKWKIKPLNNTQNKKIELKDSVQNSNGQENSELKMKKYADALSKLDEIDRVVGFKTCLGIKRKINFGFILDFIGAKINLKVVKLKKKEEDEMPNNDEPGVNLVFGRSDFYLSGRLVLYSEEMMNINKRGSFDNPISSSDFKKMEPGNILMMNNGGMFCTSTINTLVKFYKFSDWLLKSLYMNPSIQNEKDFYGLSVNVMFEDTDQIAMTLLVSSLNLSKFYIVHNGSQKFVLKRLKTMETIKLKNSKNVLKLHKYQAIVPQKDVRFMGSMLKVFNSSGNELVFDCFLEKYKKNENVKNSFKNHRETLRWLLDKSLLANAGSEEVEDQRKEARVAGNKLLALIGKKPHMDTPKVVEESNHHWMVWGGVILGIGVFVFLFWYGGVMELLESDGKRRQEEEQSEDSVQGNQDLKKKLKEKA
jgi:hypothetical protein